jgi:DNA polymerase
MNYNELVEKIKNIAESYKDEPTGGWITGDGPIPCSIMFLGEAPGKTEVESQKPFVGMAGKTFESYLNSIGLTRKDIRISNTCFFRPTKITEGKNGRQTISNRPPKLGEVELFREVLDEEIKLVDPSIIVTLGNVPLKRLTKFKSIGECHCQLYFNEDLGRNIFPMYHPSSLTYNRNDEFLKIYEEDWQKLKLALK